jgi:hypothetical protein
MGVEGKHKKRLESRPKSGRQVSVLAGVFFDPSGARTHTRFTQKVHHKNYTKFLFNSHASISRMWAKSPSVSAKREPPMGRAEKYRDSFI